MTPRHAVRQQWNDAAIRKFCQDKKRKLFRCPADDRISERKLNLRERYGVAARNRLRGKGKRQWKTNDLPFETEMAIGMVTCNVETDLDITNGARGEIVDIILHPDESPLEDGPVVKLKYLPLYLLVKLARTKASRLPGLEENIIPVEVAIQWFQIKVKGKDGVYVS